MDLTVDEVNAFLKEGFPSSYNGGSRCEDLGEGWAVSRWIYDPEVLRPGGWISGPTQFGAADLAFYMAVFTLEGIAPMAVTSDLNIHFLRPAKGGDLLARCDILKAGRSGWVGDVKIWIDGAPDALVATARGRYIQAKG